LFGYLLGLLASAIFDLPSGPMIAWLLAILAAGFYLITQIIDSKSTNTSGISYREN